MAATPEKRSVWKAAVVIWAVVVVAVLAVTATGVVMLFGSKFGRIRPPTADELAGPHHSKRAKSHDAGTPAAPEP